MRGDYQTVRCGNTIRLGRSLWLTRLMILMMSVDAEAHPWTVNCRWTEQGWLPLSQAASSHGDRAMIELLLDNGADPSLSVGSPDDRATIVEMARYGKNPDIADWLPSNMITYLDRRPSVCLSTAASGWSR